MYVTCIGTYILRNRGKKCDHIMLHLRLDLGDRFGKTTAEGLLVNHDLTQEELAQLVGASRETVNKALADFAGRGWLKLDGRAVLITDLERLEKRGK